MHLTNFDLSGKVAVVTGGSRGIGRAAALALAEAGCNVVISARHSEGLEDVAHEITALGRRVLAVRADMTKVDDIYRMVDQTATVFGRVDILVNNAGINIPKPALEVTEEDWDRVSDTNLKGVFFCAQAVGRVMVGQNRGKIINIASQMAFVGYYKRAAYCASKGGVVQLTKALAIEWASHSINVNAVAPTFIETPLTAPMFADEAFREEVIRRIPMGRVGRPEDVTGAVLYLASESSDLVTGHTILVDGGWVAW